MPRQEKLAKLYRIPILLSITLFIVLIALNVTRDPVVLTSIFVGCVLGAFVLDLDFVLHAYFIEPNSKFAEMINGYVKHGDINGLFNYIHYHKQDIPDKTLNSALFQIVLAAATIFVLSSTTAILMKALVLSVFLNSIYRFIEELMHERTNQWFWNLKININRNTGYLYTLALLAVFAYSVFIF